MRSLSRESHNDAYNKMNAFFPHSTETDCCSLLDLSNSGRLALAAAAAG